jgi:enolase
MNKITAVKGREILDSRGNPTVEVDVVLASGHRGRMMVPSGASTGTSEALELRDRDPSRYRGKGVRQAVSHVNIELAQAVIGLDPFDQENLDRTLIEADGTPNKSRLGANTLLGISFAAAHAAASAASLPLYQYLADRYGSGHTGLNIPLPMVNMISGGLHAGKNIDLQDFLIVPVGAEDYTHALEMVTTTYRKLQSLLIDLGFEARLLADEGGFGPKLVSNREALDMLCEAILLADLIPGKDMAIALDVASSHFYDASRGSYVLKSEDRELSSSDMVDMLEEWVTQYPIVSIEDGLSEEDWGGWTELTERLGSRVQLVGDDLYTTNRSRIEMGIRLKAGNSVLVKMNQIGTLTETADAVRLAKAAGFTTVISARSGETEDATLADLAVGLSGGQIKIGSVAGSSRLAKYNQLLRIHEELKGAFAGKAALGRFIV